MRIYKVIHKQKHKSLTERESERRLGALDKQALAGERRTAAQIRPAPSFPGSVNTTANISPAVVFSEFFTLLIRSVSEEAGVGGVWGLLAASQGRPGSATSMVNLREPSADWGGKRGGRVGRHLSPGGKMKCKFCNAGSFAAVWKRLIGLDWRLIWLA